MEASVSTFSVSGFVSYLIQLLQYEVANNTTRFVMDLALIGLFFYAFFAKSFKPHSKPEKLTDKEMEELVEAFKPEPLVPKTAPAAADAPMSSLPVVTSPPTPTITIEGRNDNIVNFATYNFLGFAHDKEIKESAKNTILKYGVGSCGPRGFYGTIDVHLDLEQRLKQFFNVEGAIYYSFGYCTVSSVIPCFAKKDDLLLVDDGVNYAVQTGVEFSRSKITYFKHNDMNELENLLKKATQRDSDSKPVKNRRFIVIQGVYENSGDIAHLDKIIELKNKYRFRVIMDDSFGIGVLGKTGRGTCEHFGIPVSAIDLFTSGLENAIGSGGGFCLGSKLACAHQSLASSGYVFSAAAPPYFSTSSIDAMNKIEANPAVLQKLAENAQLLRQELAAVKPESFAVSQSTSVPVVHVKLAKPSGDRKTDYALMQKLSQAALEQGVALVCPRYSDREYKKPEPSLRFTVSAQHTSEQIKQGVAAFKKAVATLLK